MPTVLLLDHSFFRFLGFVMTQIAGKDAALEDTLARFKQVASELGLELVEEQWLNPLPNVWSVHLAVASCPALYSNGKGSSKEAALCSAYGEIYERLATHMSFSDFYLGKTRSEGKFVHFPDERWIPLNDSEEPTPLSSEILNVKLRALYGKLQNSARVGMGYDPEISAIAEQSEHLEDEADELFLNNLIDLQSSNIERGVCALPFTNVRNGEIVYFPVNLLDNLYASNGMSAGNTEYEALVQGLSEILERYVKAKIIREGLALPLIPEKILQKYPKFYEALSTMQSDELKVQCYDASLGGKYPVVCIVLFNQSNGTCVASFGSHPIFEVAIDRTLTELMQGRTLSDLDAFDEPTFDLEQTSSIVNIESHFVDSTGLLPLQMFKRKPMFKFVSWDFTGSTHDQYKALRYIIDKLGFDIYVRTYQNLGLPVYRIIVPGMSEIYPFDDLIYNNTNNYLSYQEGIFSLPDLTEEPQAYADYIEELENDEVPDDALVAQSLGLLPDEGSLWEKLRFGELKCLLALEAEDYQRALEYAQWTLAFTRDSASLEHRRFYQCLVKYLQCMQDESLGLHDYEEALKLVYGEGTLTRVKAHLAHEERFLGLKSIDLELSQCAQHQALLKVYDLIAQAHLSAHNPAAHNSADHNAADHNPADHNPA